MIVYRLCSRDFKDLDGEGARLYGGRWNSVGTPLIYTSEHLSLCVLEQLVHLTINTIPINWVSLTIEIPDHIKGEEVNSIPLSSQETKQRGDHWIKNNNTLFLKVPSSILKSESNILINPSHPDIKNMKVLEELPFELDSRLLK